MKIPTREAPLLLLVWVICAGCGQTVTPVATPKPIKGVATADVRSSIDPSKALVTGSMLGPHPKPLGSHYKPGNPWKKKETHGNSVMGRPIAKAPPAPKPNDP